MEKLLFIPQHRNNKEQLLTEMTNSFYLVLERDSALQYLPGCAIKMEQEIRKSKG